MPIELRGGSPGGSRTYKAQDHSLRNRYSPTNRSISPVKSRFGTVRGYNLDPTVQLVDNLGRTREQYYAEVGSTRPTTTTAPTVNTGGWINQLRSASGGGGPKLPAQINLDNYKMPAHINLDNYKMPEMVDIDAYRTQIATIEDIAKKYGFDYSREYADRQAEAMAQAQRDAIQAARERSAWETQRAEENIQHDFFKQYLQQRQQLTDSGLNAGIASERDLRLGMNMQHALADIFANAQLYNQELDRRSQTIEQEALAYADRLYNERLAQGFDQAMRYTDTQFRENQAMLEAALRQRGMAAEEARWLAEMAMQQRQQQVAETQWRAEMDMQQRNQRAEEEWRRYEFNNMSAAERARLIADAERFGAEMAWQRHKFEASKNLELELARIMASGGY